MSPLNDSKSLTQSHISRSASLNTGTSVASHRSQFQMTVACLFLFIPQVWHGGLTLASPARLRFVRVRLRFYGRTIRKGMNVRFAYRTNNHKYQEFVQTYFGYAIIKNMKFCPKCKSDMPLSNFHKSSVSSTGTAGWCKDCISEYGKSRYVRRKAQLLITPTHKQCNTCFVVKSRNDFSSAQAICKSCHSVKLKLAKYGLDTASLGTRCAICGSIDNLVIDHDHSCCPGSHTCGKCIRGLLCRKCNSGLGMFNDNPQLLVKASNYLSKPNSGRDSNGDFVPRS
jgi:Recombination endonuclease VII